MTIRLAHDGRGWDGGGVIILIPPPIPPAPRLTLPTTPEGCEAQIRIIDRRIEHCDRTIREIDEFFRAVTFIMKAVIIGTVVAAILALIVTNL